MSERVIVNSSQPVNIELHKKRSSAVAFPFKIVATTVGIFGLLIGFILCCTIIGALLGFPMMLGGYGFLMAAANRQKVECPHCHHKRNYVKNTVLNFTCAKCKQLTIIDWVK